MARAKLSRLSAEEKSDKNTIRDVQGKLSLASGASNRKEIKFASAIDCLLQGARIIDADYNIRYVNPPFIKLSGVKAENVVGKKCYEVFRSSLCNTSRCRLARILNGEKAVEAEVEIEDDSGGKVSYMVSAFPMHDEDNNIIAIMESFRDLTSMKMLEDRVKEAEERYKAIVELTGEVGEGIMTLEDVNGREGVITFASQQCARMTGYSSKELLEKTFFELLSEDDRLPALDRHRRKIRGESLPGLYEMEIIRKDGKRTLIELTSALTIFKDRPANVTYLRDIGKRKQDEALLRGSEAKYKGMFLNAPIGIMELDYSRVKNYLTKLMINNDTDLETYFNNNPDAVYECVKRTRSTGVNKVAIKLMEVGSSEEFREHFRYIHRHDQKWVRLSFIGLYQGKKSFNYNEPVVTATGKKKFLKVHIALAPGYEDTWAIAYVCFMDLTELVQNQHDLRRQLEELVKQKTAQLEKQVEYSKSIEGELRELYIKESELRKNLEEQITKRIQFTRAVVHELKTPLTPIIGANQLLAENIKQDPWAALIRQSFKGSIELDKKISELLDLTRNEAGVLKLNYSWVDIGGLVADLMKEVDMFCTPQNVIKLHVSRSLPMVYCDGARIRQVLSNLVRNAIEHTLPGTAVTIKVNKKKTNIYFRVEDAGQGIDKSRLKDIFEPYSKINWGDEYHGGLGIGLSICKTLVNLHGGKITVRSVPQKGTCFSFTIPISGNIRK